MLWRVLPSIPSGYSKLNRFITWSNHDMLGFWSRRERDHQRRTHHWRVGWTSTTSIIWQRGLRIQVLPVKPYRIPPSSNIQSTATQKCCGLVSFSLYVFTVRFFLIEKFIILRVKYVIPYYCIYTNVIPQNLNSLLRLMVAKWTFAVWFHAPVLCPLQNVTMIKYRAILWQIESGT